ncbi:bifunctional folylpolyglutamate synthase/dihydrofolate synthase [Adlercreutzia sp. JBNU-10]|uniref:Bifunctional folylpolyglutamate synthase/dihydrofolate synthase n=2 Tax=Adlercreutzia faecimuris TaxID=2897341 RepID=A0ABS9WFM9_9ACTN|nr:folylpolyglutamate synthase/dihydrofolate synthase family protein [Adlercreutzia sp. JBNU-10]MCI2241380.1 bifunctional folylpolyglutamate synthase/dihydrofolate synthase [Adlercreutzia sp. JBNU-10]
MSAGAASAPDAGAFDPVAYINTPRWQASRLGLDRIRALLERLGRPQDALRFVHVAGTNGKGSTCAYLASVLQAAGLRTGLFTSPFILRFEERIRVDGADIPRDDLTRATLLVREQAEALEHETGDHPTEFELMCAVALVHFRAARCDIVVMEVGLGGRLDSTNVIDAPETCVIARIGLDHTALLGDTLAAVAGEKCGIIKPGAPVASWPQDPEADEVVRRACAAAGCKLVEPDFTQLQVSPLELPSAVPSVPPVPPASAASPLPSHEPCEHVEGAEVTSASSSQLQNVSRETFVRHFAYKGARYETALLGSYQPANAALAIEAVGLLRERGWRIPDEAVRAGIAAARWPGRFEVVAATPLTIVDGGHNPQGARALADSLADLLSALSPASHPRAGCAGADADEASPAVAPSAAVPSPAASTPATGAPAASSGAASASKEYDREGHQKVVLVMGVLADKDYPAMIAEVAPLADAFVCYAPDNPRALPAVDLAAAIAANAPDLIAAAPDGPSAAAAPDGPFAVAVAPGAPANAGESPAGEGGPLVEVAPGAAEALRRGRALAGADGIVVAFGSLYAIADLSRAL